MENDNYYKQKIKMVCFLSVFVTEAFKFYLLAPKQLNQQQLCLSFEVNNFLLFLYIIKMSGYMIGCKCKILSSSSQARSCLENISFSYQ